MSSLWPEAQSVLESIGATDIRFYRGSNHLGADGQLSKNRISIGWDGREQLLFIGIHFDVGADYRDIAHDSIGLDSILVPANTADKTELRGYSHRMGIEGASQWLSAHRATLARLLRSHADGWPD